MAINFPDSPTLNQEFTSAGRTWKWDGTTWVSIGNLTVADITDLTATATEINYTDGVSSAIQTQLDSKASFPSQTGNAGELLVTDGTNVSWSNTVTANSGSSRALIIQGAVGQGVALQEWKNSLGTVLAAVTNDGTLTAVPASPAASISADHVGYMGIPEHSTAKTGAYTITLANAGKHIYSTASRTVTIPANSSVAFEIGTTIVFISGAGATTTIAIDTDTLLLAGTGATGSRTLAAHGMATAVKVASTTWYISGNGLT